MARSVDTVAGSKAVGDLVGGNWDTLVSTAEGLTKDAREKGFDEAVRNGRVQLRAMLGTLGVAAVRSGVDVRRVHRAHLALSLSLPLMAGRYGAVVAKEATAAWLEGVERSLLEPAIRATFEHSREDTEGEGYQPDVKQ